MSSRPRPPLARSTPREIPGPDTWRYTGPFSRFNRFKRIFPGFGIASVAFAGYCVYEYFFLKDEHHHGEGHH
ncbi:NADH ubiquinone oxidoreductase B12 subunit [Aspergillus fumigatus]|nr:NADH ubiquinone oxidoreductase B12 subunit [Aspergillus fumigatus]